MEIKKLPATTSSYHETPLSPSDLISFLLHWHSHSSLHKHTQGQRFKYIKRKHFLMKIQSNCNKKKAENTSKNNKSNQVK